MKLFQNRLQELINEFAKGNNSRFASLVNSDEAKIRNYLKGTQPKLDFIQSVMNKFEINFEWFILGKGSMFEKEQKKIIIDSCSNENETNNSKVVEISEGIMSLLELIRNDQKDLITNLKNIQVLSETSQEKLLDVSHNSDDEREVAKLKADLAAGKLSVRNPPVKRKASEKK
ncbi:hypothetical protein F0919_18125 [Taibaiella lutea]|uniref:XRE family transcriptional regulator n=1 Tax=Taibaiella lutea TaxID=2608001 RepID=A0A5M6CBX2_9BACT|nr:hypothetical protein [Taibaiella lutea]KAA5532698.1 hypothetical protein F0919_18125 [Taibaiella lutea]